MSRFLDVHSIKKINESTIRNEFGVKQLNVLYNKAADLCFCFLEAPSRDSVEKHHQKYDIKCEWITEVQTLV